MNSGNVMCTVYLLALVAAGYVVLAALRAKSSRLEMLGMSACLGPAVMGWLLIAISLMGHAPTRSLIVSLSAAFAVAAIYFLIRQWGAETSEPRRPIPVWWMAVVLVAAGYGLYIIAQDAVIFPTMEWDAFAIWQLKAKIFVDHALWPRPDYFFNLNLSFSHVRYPVLVPMISAGCMAMTGPDFSDLGKSPYLLMYAGLGLVIFAAIRRMRGGVPAVLATSMMVTLPEMLSYGGTGTAEMALVAFYGCSVVALLRWIQHQQWPDLILTALFSAALAWTKNEGSALAAINGLVLLFLTPHPLARRNLIAAVTMGAIVAVMYAPWMIYAHNLPRTDEDYGNRFTIGIFVQNAGRLPLILQSVGEELVNTRHWVVFWMMPVALAVFNWRALRGRAVIALWMLLILQMSAYVAVYVVTTWDVGNLMEVSLHRLILHMAPAAAILIGMLWPTERIFKRANRGGVSGGIAFAGDFGKSASLWFSRLK